MSTLQRIADAIETESTLMKGGHRNPIEALECLGTLLEELQEKPENFDLVSHLARQREWSQETFGPGSRFMGLIDHISRELEEIRAEPNDLSEWIDVVILALDGAWRAGYSPVEIVEALKAKHAKNEAMEWPDWRTMREDEAIEHKKPGGSDT